VALAAPLPLQRQTRPHPGGAEPPKANRSQARSAGHGHRADGITFWGSPLSPLLCLKANGSRCQAACPSSTSCGTTPSVASVLWPPCHAMCVHACVLCLGGGLGHAAQAPTGACSSAPAVDPASDVSLAAAIRRPRPQNMFQSDPGTWMTPGLHSNSTPRTQALSGPQPRQEASRPPPPRLVLPAKGPQQQLLLDRRARGVVGKAGSPEEGGRGGAAKAAGRRCGKTSSMVGAPPGWQTANRRQAGCAAPHLRQWPLKSSM
jgi:hypothetical protein